MDVSPPGSGSILVNGEEARDFPFTYSYEQPTLVHLEAIPAPGYEFGGWRRDVTGHENPTELTIDCYKVVTADFSPLLYTLTVRTDGAGTVAPPAGAHEYKATTVIALRATPDSGWQFDGWSGDVADASLRVTTVTIDSNKEVAAHFSLILQPLNIQIQGSGSTTPAAGSHDYAEGTLVILSAHPSLGWRFDGWSGDVADPGSATTTVSMDSVNNVTANFTRHYTGLVFGGVFGIVVLGIISLYLVRKNRS